MKNPIAMGLLWGVALGNAVGVIIGSIFFKENIGVGLIIGNASGIVLGVLIGAMINSRKH